MEKYAKIRKIGEGSFGVAYLARSKDMKDRGKQVVLKEINISRMSKKERDEARNEVSVLAQLKHSNIVLYLESFEEAGLLCIVMDFCDGGDLYSRINAQRGVHFTEEQILDWFVQMCLAVKHIHDRKILHRDIKSQNIFLTKHGMVKLGDFGIAKVLNSTTELARTCIGTPYYLSPEICDAKPYNNKSDIWSLGCVLYELTNLKHAFEAGNMKALVLKIVRGSYPPPPSKYSLDLRSLISELFRPNPRDRPSVNTILRKPLLQAKIRKFLSDLEIAEEFSHTVMHGVKLQKALTPGAARPGSASSAASAASRPGSAASAAGGTPGARPLPPKPIAARKPPTPAAPRYNPASVYAPPSAVRKSKDSGNRKSSESRKSNGAAAGARSSGSANSRPSSAGSTPGQQDLAKKRQELVERERERREEVRKRQEAEYARQHKELLEKQKMARIQKLREEGWQNVIGSPVGDNVAAAAAVGKKDDVKLNIGQVGGINAVAVREVGNYDQHFANLRRLDEQRVAGGGAVDRNNFSPVQAAKLGQAAGNAGALAAERAQIRREFLLRKQEAAQNRMKGRVGGGGFIERASPGPAGDQTKDDSQKDKESESLMAKLQQVRQQNLHYYDVGGAMPPSVAVQRRLSAAEAAANEAEVRRKKIEAIKSQAAEQKERRIREELEKKRREGYELEQKRLQLQVGGRPISAPPERHIGLTGALQAIGGKEQDKSADDIKKEKEGILKRINAKPPLVVKLSDRPKWGGMESGGLGDLDLEETASCMEATTDVNAAVKPVPTPQRKQWGSPRDTVVRILSNANITPEQSSSSGGPGSTVTIDSLRNTPGQLPANELVNKDASSKQTTNDAVSEVELADNDDEQVTPTPAAAAAAAAAKDTDDSTTPVNDAKSTPVRVDAASKLGATVDKTPSVLFTKSPSAVAHGLSTGHFDAADIKLLRTCSEPDLSRLSRQRPFGSGNQDVRDHHSDGDEVAMEKEVSLSAADEDELIIISIDGDDITMSVDELAADSSSITDVTGLGDSEQEDGHELGEDEEDRDDDGSEEDSGKERISDDDGTVGRETESVDENVEEEMEESGSGKELGDDSDEDLRTMRASMASLLANDDSGDEPALSAAFKPKKKKGTKKGKTLKKTKKKKIDGASSLPRVWSETSIEDIQCMKETMKSLLQPVTPGRVPAAAAAAKSDLVTIQESVVIGVVNVTKSTSHVQDLTSVSSVAGNRSANERWLSDDDADDDYFEEVANTFSRLEEIRAKLEKDLGLELFRDVYRVVQGFQESDDVLMDEGIKQVTKMLGHDKVQFYQSILQLVMADGAYTEGNV